MTHDGVSVAGGWGLRKLIAMQDGPDATAWPTYAGSPRWRRPIRRALGPVVALIGLATTAVGARYGHAPHRALMTADGVLVGAGFLAAVYAGPRLRPPARIAALTGLYLAGSAFAVLAGDLRALAVLAYPIIASGVLLPPLWTRVIGTVAAVVEVGLSWWVRGAPSWDVALLLMFVAYVLTGINQLSRTVAELRAARDEIATLSVAAERARVARDLHDVLGHSLTTITVKTSLARRVLESGADRARAVAEIHDAERLSRETLDEIRATVSGYRRASLTAELAGARSALRGAGIGARLPRSADDVRVDLREPFAHVLREGVTNVIRHSGATTCEVRMTPTSIEIRDDGPPAAPAQPGTGLTGLAERLAAAGARIEAGPLPDGGFRLAALAVEP
ncbi:two-component sensor histidine kinase [Actinoallomurus iriomotensis]|uniref:Two-component sensor histidine kinase n=2 Tax=Actinoallomurus iriomotensis TaxID=478107 RepID=A0A9W6RZF5_9ACTN|nr:two-component sensor histidine kinase [Actinoallomurus iriomotensis]